MGAVVRHHVDVALVCTRLHNSLRWYADELSILWVLAGCHQPPPSPTGSCACCGAAMPQTPLLLALLLSLLPALLAVDCAQYAADGYCEQPKYAAYMAKHCATSCASSSAAADQEDEATCTGWAQDGYCTHSQFKSYMAKHCPNTCGTKPAVREALDEPAEDEAAAAAAEEEEEDWEEEKEELTSCAADDEDQGEEEEQRSDPPPSPERAAARKATEEAFECRAWAREGRCVGEYAKYMELNCKHTCAETAAGRGDSATEDHQCVQWAHEGHCARSSPHYAYMSTSCVEACAANSGARDPNEGYPNPRARARTRTLPQSRAQP